MHIFQVYKGQWVLTPNGYFKADPWFIVGGNQVLDMGFGRPPKEFQTKTLNKGVIIPGLVNAHCRLEHSALKDKLPAKNGPYEFERKLRSIATLPSSEEKRKAALEEIEFAYSRGTYFYNEVSRDPQFSDFLRGATHFKGNRFVEVVGLKKDDEEQAIFEAMLAMDNDPDLLPTAHSLYRSSSKILQFIRDRSRYTSMTINLLEEKDEWELPFERGALFEALKHNDDYQRQASMYHTPVLSYLKALGMLSFKKLFMINLTFANRKEIDYLNDELPHSAWVLCQRATKFYNQKRKNWPLLAQSPIKMMIGTESVCTSGNASVIDEIYHIAQDGQISEADLFLAATFSAYDYMELHPMRIPYFLFPDAEPNIESIYNTKKAQILRG